MSSDEWLHWTDPEVQEMEKHLIRMGEGGSTGFFTIKSNVLGGPVFRSAWRDRHDAPENVAFHVKREKEFEEMKEQEADIIV